MENSASFRPLSLESLKAAPSPQVKYWLRDAVSAYLATKSPVAFAPFQDWIGKGDTVAADIHLIYLAIPHQHRGAWQRAVADLIAELPADQDNAQLLGVLVDAARYMSAREVFERAGRRLASRNFAELRLPNGETLFRRCLKMAIELATDTDGMRDALTYFAQSPFFPRVLALQTLAALGRSDPPKWTEYLDLLRLHISDLLENDPPSARGIRRQAEALLAAIGIEQAVRGLEDLRRAPDHAPQLRTKCDDWVINEFFLGPDPLIKQIYCSDRPLAIFYLASDPSVRAVVDKALLDKSIVDPDPIFIKEEAAAPEPTDFTSRLAGYHKGPLGDLRRRIDDGLGKMGIRVNTARAPEPAL